MRHWFLIFLIALLPLRGWAAGGMATQMAVQHGAVMLMEQPLIATENIANYQASTGTSGTFYHKNAADDALQAPPDCPGHASHGAALNPVAGEQATPLEPTPPLADCGSACGVCQICHSVALTVSLPQTLVGGSSPAVSSAYLPRFTSADRALSLKPPIA